jgi:uncharacterized membrane protein
MTQLSTRVRIVLMALTAYLTRIGGYALLRKRAPSPRPFSDGRGARVCV